MAPKARATNGNEVMAEPTQDTDSTPAYSDEFSLFSNQRWPALTTLVKEVLVTPIKTRPFSFKAEMGPMFAVLAFALMLYGLTAPREVALEDDGLFLMLLEFFGVGHPPGYPLYSLLGSPFYKLLPDFLSPAYRGHMFSSFAGAIACVAIYAIVVQLCKSRMCAFFAAIAYACSEIFWSQAIIAEVYTLNAAMYFLVFAFCVNFAATPHDRKPSWLVYCLIAFLYGLSLTNHWPLIGLGSICLLLLVLPQWRTLLQRSPVGVILLLVGLLPYVWMIWRSHSDVALNFYGPIESFQKLWFYVTRSGYSGVDQQSGVGLEEKLHFISFFSSQLVKQITPLGLGIALTGLVAMLRTREHLLLGIAMIIGWIMTGPLLIFLLNFQAEFIWFSAFRVYFLPCYGFVLIWFGYGLAWICSQMQKRVRLQAAYVAGSSLGLIVVALSLTIHWKFNDRSDYTWARDIALFKLTSTEENTHLFTFDDLDLPVGYMNLVEKVRPDIKIYNDQGLVFGRRIYSPFTPDQDKTRIINELIRSTNDPIYYHPFRIELFDAARNGTDFLGFWRRVNTENNSERIILSDRLLYWLENNVSEYPLIEDRWTRQQSAGIVATLISSIVKAASNGYPIDPRWEDVFAAAYTTNELVHLLLLWRAKMEEFGLARANEEFAWIDEVVGNPGDYIFDNSNYADLMLARSKLLFLYPDLADDDIEGEYEQTLLRGLDFEFKDTVFLALTDFYRGKGEHQKSIDLLKDHFGTVSKAPVEFRKIDVLLKRELKDDVLLRPVLKFDS